MPSVKSIKNLNCPCIISPAPPPSPCNPPSPQPRNQPTPKPPPPHTTAKPPEIPSSSPPYYFHPSTKSHAPLLAPPPYFSPIPNSPPLNALKTGGGGGNHTTIIVACTSLGGLFFLAFLSVGIFFSAKKTKLPIRTPAAVPSVVPEPQRAAGNFGGEVGTTSKAADKGMHGGRPPSHEGGELAGGATAPPEAPQPYGIETGGGKEISGANEGVNTKGKKGYLQDQSTGPCGGEDGSSAAPEKGNGGEQIGGGDEGTNTKAAGDRDNLLPDESTEPHGGEDDGSAAPEKGDGDEKIDDGDLHKEATEQYGGDQDDGSAQPENLGEEIGDGDLPAEEATEKDGGGDDGSAATEKVDGGEETGGADNRERNAFNEKIKKIAASRKKRKGSRGPSTTATNQMKITAATAAVTTLFKAQNISESLQDLFSPTDQANESSTTPITDNDPLAADESNTPTPTDDPHADESSSTTQTDNSKANYSKNEATKEQFFEGSGDWRSRESEVRPRTQGVDRKLLAHQPHKNKAQQYDSENIRGKKLVPHTQKSREFDQAASAETSLDYYYHGFDSCLKQISTHLEAILDRDAGLDTLPEPQDPQSHEEEKEGEGEEEEDEEEA